MIFAPPSADLATALMAMLTSILTYVLVPPLGRILRARGMVGIDVHKPERPVIPESGGIVLAAGLTLFLSFLAIAMGQMRILYVLAVSLLFGFYGLIDDMVKLGKYEKLFCSTLIGAFAAVFSGLNGVAVVLAGLFVLAVGNMPNLFAGLNGLEVGSSTIISFFLAVCAFIGGNRVAGFAALGFFLILLAFLLHNKYPARIFPGDCGTLLIGGFFASLALYYNLWNALVPLLSLHIADCLLKGSSAGYFSYSEKRPTKVLRSGILRPRRDFLSFVRLLLKLKPMKEPEVVRIVWALEIMVGTLTTAIWWAIL